jgi:hypothetical protein
MLNVKKILFGLYLINEVNVRKKMPHGFIPAARSSPAPE